MLMFGIIMACNNSESSKELNTDSIKENVGDTSVKKEDIDEKKELVEQPIKPSHNKESMNNKV